MSGDYDALNPGARVGLSAKAQDVPVGRELDALVAERVLGLAVEWVGGDPKIRMDTAEWRGWNAMPAYSTDISAAWEALHHIGWLVSVCLMDGGVWSCKFIGQERVTAPTAPEAICRAALAWAARK